MSHRFIDRRAENVSRESASSGGSGLFRTPRNTGQSDFYRPRPWFWSVDKKDITSGDWPELVAYSRQIFAQIGDLSAAILQKNNYAVGNAWRPQFKGLNQAWGQEAEEWLHHVWLPNCDVRGGVFDFQTQLLLSGIAWDVDGDDAVIFTADEHGFPKLKFCDATDIGSAGQGEVKGGVFDGARLCHGIILDRHNAMIGARLLTPSPYGGERNVGPDSEYTDVPAYHLQMLFEPEWRSPSRGIPRLAKVILDWFDIEDIDDFLKRGVKMDASQGILVTNEAGRADDSRNYIVPQEASAAAVSDIAIEKRMGGEFWYLRANAGEKVEPYRSERPHPNTEAFVARIARRGFLAAGWFIELLNPSQIGGASVRLIQDQARHSIRARQRTQERRARRCIQYAVSVAMERGLISKNNDGGDFLRWAFEMPCQLTVDAGYDEQADRENLLMGTASFASITEKKGRWWEEVRSQRQKENEDLINRAIALVQHAAAQGQALTLREGLDMMQRDAAMQRMEPGRTGGGGTAPSAGVDGNQK